MQIDKPVRRSWPTRPLAATMALGFVLLGWLLMALALSFGVVALASPGALDPGGLMPVLGLAVTGAFFVVFGEACLAIFRLVEIRGHADT